MPIYFCVGVISQISQVVCFIKLGDCVDVVLSFNRLGLLTSLCKRHINGILYNKCRYRTSSLVDCK
jgi:hypothetical protein